MISLICFIDVTYKQKAPREVRDAFLFVKIMKLG